MKRLLFSLALITIVTGATIAATRAFFTSQDTLGATAISSGTIKLDLNGENNKIIGLGGVTNMLPGQVSEEGVIDIYNVGNSDFAWVGKFVLSGDSQLPKVIYFKDMQMEFLKPDKTTWEPLDKFITNGRGSGSYPGEYNRIADLDPLKVVTLDTWVKNNSGMIPPYPYFHGALKPGYQYRITFTLAMHKDATNTYMGRTMGLGFQANATQMDAEAIYQMLDGLSTPDSMSAINSRMDWLNAQLVKQD